MISYIYTGKLILTFEFNTPSSIFPYTQITNLKEKEKKERSTLISYNLKMLEIMRRCKSTINSEMHIRGGAENNYTFAAEIIIWNANTIIQR